MGDLLPLSESMRQISVGSEIRFDKGVGTVSAFLHLNLVGSWIRSGKGVGTVSEFLHLNSVGSGIQSDKGVGPGVRVSALELSEVRDKV